MHSSDAASASSDEQFQKTVTAIEKRLHLLGRLPQVRIKAWLAKLRQSTSNLTWKRNRNLYARLLLEQLRAGCLEVPFHTLPPQGSLPTLPAYLTYRFLSPPHQGSNQEQQNACGLSRPRSADCSEGPWRQRSSPGSHKTWTVEHSPTDSWPQRTPNAAGVLPAFSQLSAMSPVRCGSPPRRRCLSGQEQGQYISSPDTRKGSIRAVCTPPAASVGQQVLPSQQPGGDAAWRSCYGVQQRPSSPAAAGLLDAAAALAAEVEADRSDTAMLENRLRYAEEKLLQQEAELVRLQSQAAAARRRLKAATASTLGDLVERYSSATKAWGKAGSPGSLGDRQMGYGEAVYNPMWQLLSSIQQVLDTCDQQEYQWQQDQAGTAAAAIARFEPALAAEAGLGDEASNVWLDRRLLQAAAAAITAEPAIGKQLKELMKKLLQQAKHVVTAMETGKSAATSAAGGGTVSPADVAATAADALRAMLKSAKHLVNKDSTRLVRQIDAATDSAAEAVAATSRLLRGSSSSSSSSDGGSSSNSEGNGTDSSEEVAHAEQLQVQQRCQACLVRLQEVYRVLSEFSTSTGKVLSQLSDGQRRLLEISKDGNSCAASSLLASHDRGVAAAATAGITASLSAATSTYVAHLKELKVRLCNMSNPSSSGSHKAGWSGDGQQSGLGRANSATVSFQQVAQQPSTLSRASSATHTPRAQVSWLNVPKPADAALAGTFGSSGLSSPRTLSPSKTADTVPKGFNSVAHYLIGGAAASSGSSPAAGVSKLLSSPPASPRLSSLQANSSSVGTSTLAPNPAAESVHQRLASLSRQASRISERTSQILGASNSALTSSTISPETLSAGGMSSRAGAASPRFLSGGSLSGGLEALSKTSFWTPSLSAMPLSSSLSGGLKSSVAAVQAPQVHSTKALGSAAASLGSLLSRSTTFSGAAVPRPASASPRLSMLTSSTVASGLVGGVARTSSLGGSSLAALSSRLSSLPRSPVLGSGP